MFARIRNVAGYAASLEIWVVTLGVAVSFISARFLLPAVIVAAVFWPIRWAANGRLSVRTPADWPVALIVLLVPITLWATALPEITLTQVYRLLVGIAFYYAIANWAASRSRLKLLVSGALAAGVGLALFALVSVQWNSGKLPFIPAALYARFPALVSDTAHPNVMAGSLIILLPCALGLLVFHGLRLRWYELALSVLATAAIGGVLVLTQSRGALIGLGVILMMMPLLRWRLGWLLPVLGAIAVSAVIAWAGTDRLVSLAVANPTLGGIEGRVEVWSRAIYMIKISPLLELVWGHLGGWQILSTHCSSLHPAASLTLITCSCKSPLTWVSQA